MSESLARRVARLVSGSFHAMLDKAEDCMPEAVMQENIRELERTIDEVRTELGKVLAQKHLATKKLADENNRHEQLAGQIATALDAGREDLAKAGIAEQLDIEARLPVLEQSLADCSSQERELDAFVAALLAKKREMQAALDDWKRVQTSIGGAATVQTATKWHNWNAQQNKTAYNSTVFCSVRVASALLHPMRHRPQHCRNCPTWGAKHRLQRVWQL